MEAVTGERRADCNPVARVAYEPLRSDCKECPAESTAPLEPSLCHNPWDDPSVLAQHADCILPNGFPIGFFGQGPVRTGESVGSGSSLSSGINMHGVVFDHAAMAAQRPFYIDAKQAKATGVVSTVLIFDVGAKNTAQFAQYWKSKKRSPGGFSLLGNNCSTNASEGFMAAQVVGEGIPGLDTPAKLLRQLLASRPKNSVATYSGFIGFVPRPNGSPGFDLVVE